MKEPVTMIARVTFGLVKFAFTSDDPKLRTRLFDAILDGRCPDFECSLGSPSKTALHQNNPSPQNGD